jgi:hypothetical protein
LEELLIPQFSLGQLARLCDLLRAWCAVVRYPSSLEFAAGRDKYAENPDDDVDIVDER